VVEIHPALHPEDVLVADRGFCSYSHVALLWQRGVHAVFRIHQKQIVDFTPGRPHVTPRQGKNRGHRGKPRSRWLQQFAPHDHLVEWCKPVNGPEWMTATQFAHLPQGVVVRELRYHIPRKGFRVHTITLATTLLDAVRYPGDVVATLYGIRWQVETHFAHLKTTMGLDVVKCHTVDGVLKELIVFALIYNFVRLVMGEAARRQQVEVERISFIDAARWLATARVGDLLPFLVVNPQRPNRYEPRVRKRRPKLYPLLHKPRNELRKSLTNATETG
jgi:hypothetical protein